MDSSDLPSRPVIAQSWHRVARTGLRPGATIDHADLEDADQNSRLMVAATPVLDEVATALEGTGFVVVLADASSIFASVSRRCNRGWNSWALSAVGCSAKDSSAPTRSRQH